MQRLLKPTLLTLVPVACLLWPKTIAVAHAAETNPPVLQAEIPKSFFTNVTNDVKVGKDPFFPASTRGPKGGDGPPPPPPPEDRFRALKHVVLKALSSEAGGRRLALINNSPLATGEELSLRTPDGNLKVRCLEIRDRSVWIRAEVGGAVTNKELLLRSGL